MMRASLSHIAELCVVFTVAFSDIFMTLCLKLLYFLSSSQLIIMKCMHCIKTKSELTVIFLNHGDVNKYLAASFADWEILSALISKCFQRRSLTDKILTTYQQDCSAV